MIVSRTCFLARQRGQLISFSDHAGNVMSMNGRNADSNPLEVRRTFGTGATAVTEAFTYTYVTAGANAGPGQNLLAALGRFLWSTSDQEESPHATDRLRPRRT